MSSASQTLDEISRLLDALPGIVVLNRHIDDQNAVLEITSHGAVSTHLLQNLCEGANVALAPPLRLRDPELHAEINRHFSLSASTEGLELIELGYLQLLGIHLVWHLHRAGEMPAEVANRYLQQWNGAQVGA